MGLRNLKKNRDTLYDHAPLASLPPDVIHVMFLGHSEIFKDFVHLWALQSLATDPKNPDPDKMQSLIDSTLRHRPKMETLYMFSCFVMKGTYKRPKSCKEIIDVGLTIFPKSFRLSMTQGYVSAFLLKKPLEAAYYYHMASQYENAPPHVKKIAVKFANDQNLSSDDLMFLDTIQKDIHGEQFEYFLQMNSKLFGPQFKGQE